MDFDSTLNMVMTISCQVNTRKKAVIKYARKTYTMYSLDFDQQIEQEIHENQTQRLHCVAGEFVLSMWEIGSEDQKDYSLKAGNYIDIEAGQNHIVYGNDQETTKGWSEYITKETDYTY